jgi:predicted HD phosphohydrolase
MPCRDLNIAGLLVKRGVMRWDDLAVTALDHALQCAARARVARACEEVVLASLLHDVGHLISDAEESHLTHHGLWGPASCVRSSPPRWPGSWSIT